MGNGLITFRLKNDGARCALRGFPEVEPLSASGITLKVREIRTHRPFPDGARLSLHTVVLGEGGFAYFLLGFRAYDYHRARRCRPIATAVDIAPPDGGEPQTVPLRFPIGFCHRVVRVSPLVAQRP